MATGEMVLFASVVALFWLILLLPSVPVISRTLLRSQRTREMAFAIGTAFCAVVGFDAARRLVVSGHDAATYTYVFGLLFGPFAVLLLISRLGRWNPRLPARSPQPAKSRSRRAR